MCKPRVYVLESKYHGSNQQLSSVASEIFKNHEAIHLKLDMRNRSKVFLSLCGLVLIMLHRFGKNGVFSRIVKRILMKGMERQLPLIRDVDVILSKAPPFEYPSAFLKVGSGATSYHIGGLKRVDRKYFDFLISTPSTPVLNPDISLEVLPTRNLFDKSSKVHHFFSDNYYLMLVGGSARGFDYNMNDWVALVDYIEETGKVDGVKWILSTSPRTGDEVEYFLKKRLDNSPHVKDLILWRIGERKSLEGLMSGAEAVFVTEDSASMLSDSINCKVPTVSLRPINTSFNSLTTPFAKYHEKRGRIIRVVTSELRNFQVKTWVDNDFSPVDYCWTESWRRQIN